MIKDYQKECMQVEEEEKIPETENIENTTNEIEDFQQDDLDEVECNQQEIEERK